MWLGSTTLAGLLLVSSLPALASTQTAVIPTPGKPILVASTLVPTGTYTKVVRKQLKWVVSPVIQSKPVTVQSTKTTETTKTTKTTKVEQTTKTTTKRSKVVQVTKASDQQVSRSNSSGLVDHALSLLGVPYVFGGTSRSGFDCSGYTQYVFKASGISLPRTAAEQFNVGSSVSRGQLQSGDLVFFTTYASGASHVGIYIGGGEFVSASNSGVSISSLGSGYYASRYLGARRVR